MTDRPHCLKPDACAAKPKSIHCLDCHARAVLRRPGMAEKAQTPEAKAKRVKSYRKTRVGFVPEGLEVLNSIMRNNHMGVEERKGVFARQEVAANERAMRRRHEAEKRSRY